MIGLILHDWKVYSAFSPDWFGACFIGTIEGHLVEAHGFSRGIGGAEKPALAAVTPYPQRLKAWYWAQRFPRLKAWASTSSV